MNWITWIIIALVAIAVFGVYISVVAKHLTVAGVAMDKDTTVANTFGFFSWLDAKTANWKTVGLALIAGVMQAGNYITTDVVTEWKDLPWAQVFDAKIAGTITLVCTFLIPIVHAVGIAKAAVTPPKT